MAERNSDRWISIAQSVLLHGAVIGALAWGWWAYRQMPKATPATLAIDATVVDAKSLQPAQPSAKKMEPPPQPEPAPPEEAVGPPAPTPEEIAQREAVEKQAQEAQQKQEEERKAEAERQAQEQQAAAEQKAREEAERKKREQEEEQKRIAEAKKQAEAKRKADEAKQRAQREADLRPPSAKPGIDCVVYVTQIPGGEVTNVRIGTCNGDTAVRESIETAVYRASPLPPPPDPSLFERNLEIRFVPND
jgi:colicin import membrane protein